jgi:hypothetical protein
MLDSLKFKIKKNKDGVNLDVELWKFEKANKRQGCGREDGEA